MIVQDFTRVEEAGKKLHYRFSVVANIGQGCLKLPGWRYYPETDHLTAPQRKVGARYIPTIFADTTAFEEIKAYVRQVLTIGVAVELDSTLARLLAMEPKERAELLQTLSTDSHAGAAVVWAWRKINGA